MNATEILTDKQQAYLSVLHRSKPLHVPVGLAELCDKDFCDLLEADLVGIYRDALSLIQATTTEAGSTRAIALAKAEGRAP